MTPVPAVRKPSTSERSMPASSRALRAASAWSWRDDLSGTIPMSSASATPTMAALRYRLTARPPG